MQKQLDALIVGGGLAGVLLAWELIKKGQKVLVVNCANIPSSSNVAAGTWNPIAFKQFCLSWRAEEMLAEMDLVYPELEKLLGTKFYQKTKVKKVVSEQNEINLWNKQATDEQMQHFLVEKLETKNDGFLAEIKHCGRVDLPLFLAAFHQYLKNENSWIEGEFNYTDLHFENQTWNYQNISAKNVIFCEGVHVQNNPYFSWIPLKPAKGDVITIHAPELKLDYILKKNIFVLPLGDDLYQVGATYDWTDLTWIPSEKAKIQLTEKLKTLIDVDFEVVHQKSGIRPAAIDRRPLIGEHPEQKGLFVFNGLGAKGVFLSPLLVKEFSDFLINGKSLSVEVDINRYLKYFKSNLF